MHTLLTDEMNSGLKPEFFDGILKEASALTEIHKEAEVSVLLTDDETIQALNAEFRNIDKPTDVLSFPTEEESMPGDVVISLDTARRQAAEQEITIEEQVAFLFVHGLLHLLGYDHEAADSSDSEEAEAMYALQNRIIANWEA